MEMDDDDFMGEIEFDLSPEQRRIVSRAITLASEGEDGDDEFIKTNPLIAIMQWWDAHNAVSGKSGQTPEEALAEVCRRFILEHEKAQ